MALMQKPRPSWDDLRREVLAEGGQLMRTKGSHSIYRLNNNRTVTIVATKPTRTVSHEAAQAIRREIAASRSTVKSIQPDVVVQAVEAPTPPPKPEIQRKMLFVTAKQHEVLVRLRSWIELKGRGPTREELSRDAGISCTALGQRLFGHYAGPKFNSILHEDNEGRIHINFATVDMVVAKNMRLAIAKYRRRPENSATALTAVEIAEDAILKIVEDFTAESDKLKASMKIPTGSIEAFERQLDGCCETLDGLTSHAKQLSSNAVNVLAKNIAEHIRETSEMVARFKSSIPETPIVQAVDVSASKGDALQTAVWLAGEFNLNRRQRDAVYFILTHDREFAVRVLSQPDPSALEGTEVSKDV